MSGASNSPPLFGRVAIIGMGLIGSSLARAMRRFALAEQAARHRGCHRPQCTLRAEGQPRA